MVAHLVGGLEPARTIMLDLLGKRQGRGHGQQGPAGRAWAGAVRSGPRAGPLDRLRGGGGRRHSDHRQHQPVPVGQSDSLDPRHPQRHQQLHPHADGGDRAPITPTPCSPRPSGWAMPRPIRRWTSTAATRRRSWRSWPIWPSAPASTGTTFRGRASTRSSWPTCATPRSWATGSSCWPWPNWLPDGLELHVSPTPGQARHAAGRGSRRVQRHQRRGRRGGPRLLPRPRRRADADRFGRGGRPDRHGRRPHGDHLPHARSCGPSSRSPQRRAKLADHAKSTGRFYLRFNVDDRPGVLAEIAGVLGRQRHFDRLGHSARSRRWRAKASCRW